MPRKQMGTNVLAAKSLGCSSGRGEREPSSSVLVSKYSSLPKLPWEERALRWGVWFGHGVFPSGGDTPHGLSLVPAAPSLRTR